MSDESVTKERSCECKTVVASLDPWNKYAFYVNPSLGKKKETVLGVRTCILDPPSTNGEPNQHGTVVTLEGPV